MVSLCVYLFVTFVSLAKTAEPIDMPRLEGKFVWAVQGPQ